MPFEQITPRTRWECIRCGDCCRGMIISKKKNLSILRNGNAVCKNLTQGNLCKTYDERPFICRLYPFFVDFENMMHEGGKARPQDAFDLDKLKIHTQCPGYGKGKRVSGNKNLIRKIDRLSYDFATRFKEKFDKGEDVTDIL